MAIRVNNVKLHIDDADQEKVVAAVCQRLRLRTDDIAKWRIVRRSLDARKKPQLMYVYSVEVELNKDERSVVKALRRDTDIILVEPRPRATIQPLLGYAGPRPVVVGAGPAGIFAALTLAEAGLRPLVLEKGQPVPQRAIDIEHFWQTGELDPQSNVQFGEGGAGTFSDGKLTTRVSDARIERVLETFVRAGAPEEILYAHKPHIGTDKLRTVVVNLRQQLQELGATVRFGAEVTNLVLEKGQIVAVEVNGQEVLETRQVILAPGHSSRATYRMLKERDLELQAKAFAIGVRIEHPQELIDTAQYGAMAGHPKLGAADYHLTYNDKAMERSAYTFCMCPGGQVVAAASELNTVVTNGMSEYARDTTAANAALVFSVTPDDFAGSDPLAGMEFQEHWEAQAFKLGGGDYKAPAQRVEDFLQDRPSNGFADWSPSYRPAVEPVALSKTLPDYGTKMLQQAIIDMDKRLANFAYQDAILTGVETRTSAPVRIVRDEHKQAAGIKGLYPAGEGAGYAGGIMSAALDGIKVAEALIAEVRLKGD